MVWLKGKGLGRLAALLLSFSLVVGLVPLPTASAFGASASVPGAAGVAAWPADSANGIMQPTSFASAVAQPTDPASAVVQSADFAAATTQAAEGLSAGTYPGAPGGTADGTATDPATPSQPDQQHYIADVSIWSHDTGSTLGYASSPSSAIAARITAKGGTLWFDNVAW